VTGCDVVIVDTGLANIASVRAAFQRLGAHVEVTTDSATVDSARAAVLPGVGAFGPGMQRLKSMGLLEPMRQRITEGRASLAICLGMQLLGNGSEESPGVQGLGVVPWDSVRFGESARKPQFGWNTVTPDEGCALLEPGYAYFANSYCVRDSIDGWCSARTEYDAPFVSAAERGALLACQFHPELSGAWGMRLLERWLAAASEVGAAC